MSRARRKPAIEVVASPRRRRQRKVSLRQHFSQTANSLIRWIRSRQIGPERRLRLAESVSLGEKRFAAVLEFEGQRFLVGGGATSVQLLTELRNSNFIEALASSAVAAGEK